MTRLALIWLTCASLFFYGYWNIAYLPLLLISITINYLLGRTIERVENSRFFLILGILFNLGLLGYFKYSQFFLNSLHQLFGFPVPSVNIILPLAISFYSFTQIAYLVDAFQGKTKIYHYNFLSYSLFVSFFPQLIAGPILRYNELLPQFQKLRIFILSQKNLALGLTLFILGLFKKVAIADNLSPWVTEVFNHASEVTFLEAWVGTFAYTFQLYFDFSGYSDMAIGLGWIFNIHLPINFNSPYKANSIRDFWRRWHITLSNFLRDYLYIPFGGNRYGRMRQYVNLLMTMLLGGLWHGAGWNFVIWGGLHGLGLVVNNIWHNFNLFFPKQLGWLMTFLFVTIGWVIFRAQTLQDSWEILKTMMGINPLIFPENYARILNFLPPTTIQFKAGNEFLYFPNIGIESIALIFAGLSIGVTWFPNTQEIISRFKPNLWIALGISILGLFSLLSMNKVSEFLYFQF
ncbi:MAG: MBOAT family protein [Spirulina sp.]